jgi:DNA-binding LytR/AlgR family response regulator
MTNEKKIVCLAVDDEPPALDILKKYISAVSSLELAGTCNNAVEALNVLQSRNIDLLFLDIQMPQLLGTDLIRSLNRPPKVIFTTAHRKFAVEGFELDATDYLLKPISFTRFLKAVNKVLGGGDPQPEPPPRTEPQPEPSPRAHAHPRADSRPRADPPARADAFLHLRTDRKTVQIALDDVLYIESIRDYIKVVTRSKTVISKQSISSLEDILPGDAFIRIHRSYIVSLSKIESYTSELVEIARQELPISRMYRLDVEKVLQRRT